MGNNQFQDSYHSLSTIKMIQIAKILCLKNNGMAKINKYGR